MTQTKKEIFMEQMELGIKEITYYPSASGLQSYLHQSGPKPFTAHNPTIKGTSALTFTLGLTSNQHLGKGYFKNIISINGIAL